MIQVSQVSLLNFRKLMEFRSYRSYRSSDNTSNPCKLTQREPSALSSVTPELLNSKKLSECESWINLLFDDLLFTIFLLFSYGAICLRSGNP